MPWRRKGEEEGEGIGRSEVLAHAWLMSAGLVRMHLRSPKFCSDFPADQGDIDQDRGRGDHELRTADGQAAGCKSRWAY